jgi:hypothetical protein
VSPFLDGLLELWVLRLPTEQCPAPNADFGRSGLGGKATSHGLDQLLAEFRPVNCWPAAWVLGGGGLLLGGGDRVWHAGIIQSAGLEVNHFH